MWVVVVSRSSGCVEQAIVPKQLFFQWLELQEDESEEAAKEDRYGGLPGPISREVGRDMQHETPCAVMLIPTICCPVDKHTYVVAWLHTVPCTDHAY